MFATVLLAIAYTYNRPVHVFSYSSRAIFNSNQHVPQTHSDWCARSNDASKAKALSRGPDWTTVNLNNRGKSREPIRLSIHLFGRPRYAAVLQATVGQGQGDDAADIDPRVVRLFEVPSSPAQTSVRLRHWLDSWWEIEDAALWCMLGHVWQLAKPTGAGEAEARQAASGTSRNRQGAEVRQLAEQARLSAGLDPDAAAVEQRLERDVEIARQQEVAAARAVVALAPWMVDNRGQLEELAALLQALGPSRAARRETRRMEHQAG